MPIPSDVADEFSPEVRARGEEYHRAGRVRLVDTTGTHITAVVRGTMSYEVNIRERPGGIVAMSCSCPYVDEWGSPCKHLWAALVAAERIGHPLLSLDEPTRGASGGARRTPREPAWRREIQRLRQHRPVHPGAAGPARWPANRALAYVVDASATLGDDETLVLELATRAPARGGGWGSPKRFGYSQAQWLAAPDPADREIAQMLLGAREDWGYGYGYGPAGSRRFRLAPPAFDVVLRRVCATGRCHLRLHASDLDPPVLAWDDGGPWEIHVALVPHDEGRCRVEGALVRGERRVPLADPLLLVPGLVILGDADDTMAAPLHDFGAIDLARALRGRVELSAPVDDAAELAEELGATYPRLPPVELPPTLGVEAVRVAPALRLALAATHRESWQPAKVDAALAFDYAGVRVDAGAAGATVARTGERRVVHRDRAAEAAAVARLEAAGFRREYDYAAGRHVYRLLVSKVPRVAAELTAEGWEVELEGQLLRPAGATSLAVRSGIDWFELDAAVDFGGVTAALPELLAALRRGERSVMLPDGSVGVLPEEWLAKYGVLAAFGTPTETGARFGRGQVALLDALLAAVPDAATDALFERARAELARFEGVAPLAAPPGFVGELRAYQREGLGWLDFLGRFGFGGILADDMGLGKTVQVLALLEARRARSDAGPSLAVVPRSLVFNWEQEAARFTPGLRVLVYAGPGRQRQLSQLGEYDLVLTTYGTLRRDAVDFKDVEFDYAILDEAQAIKNASTATAKATRLLRARHRLAMSGTPIENRLAELWSLFEFLNPGMLGAAPAFARLAKADGTDPAARALVARAVRPFVLRRTKAQVARDLPARVEQTVWVELGPAERRLYDELRDHYRASLLGRIARDGLARSKMHVLEALLRLRQAACHPGLIDVARAGESSSKLEVLLARLADAVAEGHKVLVFSQFTSLLSIVRERLDDVGIVHEYLDGRTRDRQQRVERFQSDPACPLFLISLKAGGVGLNLTAADYVFLLDPWWNPAAEAQAIDRAHRIGQRRQVIAARLVARDTVEEKVLALQEGKRELADAILGADAGRLIATLGREELERLLG